MDAEEQKDSQGAANSAAPLVMATIKEQFPNDGIRQPKFHRGDVQTGLSTIIVVLFAFVFAESIHACNLQCHDLRDWNEVIEPYKSVVIVAIGSIIGYYFGKKND